MNRPETVTDFELHAYVDGELDPQRRVQVEAWLVQHPDVAQKVRAYQQIQDQLHQRFDSVLTEADDVPGMSGLRSERRQPVDYVRAAVVAGLMLVSGLTGWVLHPEKSAETVSVAQADLVQPATFAHRVYSTETSRPVEIAAPQQASLDRWVSQRMHTNLSAPDLQAEGLAFIGGRLLPSTNRMAAQYMYEDGQGQRVTLYVRRIADPGSGDGFQYAEKDGLHVFYWMRKDMGYAVIGEQPASRLIAIASLVQNRLGG